MTLTHAFGYMLFIILCSLYRQIKGVIAAALNRFTVQTPILDRFSQMVIPDGV
jgi:hypothetical protein